MADKSFGVKELNLLNASGTPTVTSPNNLNLNANTVAISTSCTIGSNLDVDGTTNLDNVDIVGITTIRNASGNKLYEGSANASKLFHNGSERLQTETYGIDINGTLGADQINCSGVSTITIPANTNPHSSWDVVNNGASAYRFTGPGQDGAEDNPNIYLVRGQRYIFKVNASGHPFQLRVANGGAAYSDGVTNNGAQSGNVVINVQHDAPAQLYYQCTSHGGMVGNIYIVGGPQVISGVVTATTFVGNLTGNVTGNATGLSGTPNISAGTIAGSTGTFTGDLTIPDKIVHAGDTNTAIRFPAADTITAETGGSERLRILANGAVGINTSNFSSVLNNEVGLAIHGSSNDNCRINLSTPNKSNTLIGYYGLSNRFGVDVHNGLEIRDVEDSYATRLRIDSSGRVLIGTTTEGEGTADDLTIATSGTTGITIRSGTSGEGNIFFSDGTSGAAEYAGTIQYSHASNYMLFFTNAAERLRITSDGSVGINETSPAQQLHVHDDTSYHGILINGNGAPSLSFGHNTSTTPSYKFGLWGVDHTIFALTASDNHTNPLMLWDWNENGTNATVTTSVKHTFNGVCTFNSDYQQGNSTYGLVFYGSSASSRGVVVSHGNNDFRPTHTNSVDLGTSSIRWRQLYTNNSVNTSDKNLKNTITDSDLGLSFINKLRPVSYKWNQKEEEDLDTKIHYGLIAQEIETALTSEGKSLNDFAGVFKPDDYKEDGTGGAMGISLGEIISPLIKAVQELSAKVAALEGS